MTSGKRLIAKVQPTAAILCGIAHEYRVAILYVLAQDPTWVEDLSRTLGIPPTLVVYHVRAMEAGGWITKKRVGKHVIYAVRMSVFKELRAFLMSTPLWRELQQSFSRG